MATDRALLMPRRMPKSSASAKLSARPWRSIMLYWSPGTGPSQVSRPSWRRTMSIDRTLLNPTQVQAHIRRLASNSSASSSGWVPKPCANSPSGYIHLPHTSPLRSCVHCQSWVLNWLCSLPPASCLAAALYIHSQDLKCPHFLIGHRWPGCYVKR